MYTVRMTRIKSSHPLDESLPATGSSLPCFSRRRTIVTLLVLSAATLFSSLGRMVMSFILPPKQVNSFGGIVEVGPLTHLPAAGSSPKQIPHGHFWLTHTDNGIAALHSSCTHLECLFSWDPEQHLFICPCHGSTFNIEGQVMKGPAQRDLDRFPIRLVTADGILLRDSDKGVMAVHVADLIPPKNTQPDTAIGDATVSPILVQVDTGQKIISP